MSKLVLNVHEYGDRTVPQRVIEDIIIIGDAFDKMDVKVTNLNNKVTKDYKSFKELIQLNSEGIGENELRLLKLEEFVKEVTQLNSEGIGDLELRILKLESRKSLLSKIKDFFSKLKK